MDVNRYRLVKGRVEKQPLAADHSIVAARRSGESWYDVGEVEPDRLRVLLAPLALHQVLLERCVKPAADPSVLSVGRATLLQFPCIADAGQLRPTYLTIVLQGASLITIRHSAVPALDCLARDFQAGTMPPVEHLPELVYLMIDRMSDANVDAGVELRDRIAEMAQVVVNRPGSVTAAQLGDLRAQVDGFVSLIEDQLYCVTGLSSSDNEALADPHRKAFIQDLAGEAEVAQRSAYRLEGRMGDLQTAYEMAGTDRVEKRLRILTIVSTVTLPLALISGLLGMNVGGLPGIDSSYGFAVVITLMLLIVAAEIWYFARARWFD